MEEIGELTTIGKPQMTIYTTGYLGVMNSFNIYDGFNNIRIPSGCGHSRPCYATDQTYSKTYNPATLRKRYRHLEQGNVYIRPSKINFRFLISACIAKKPPRYILLFIYFTNNETLF